MAESKFFKTGEICMFSRPRSYRSLINYLCNYLDDNEKEIVRHLKKDEDFSDIMSDLLENFNLRQKEVLYLKCKNLSSSQDISRRLKSKGYKISKDEIDEILRESIEYLKYRIFSMEY